MVVCAEQIHLLLGQLEGGSTLKNAAYTEDKATDTASWSRIIKESNGEKSVLLQTFEINEEVKRAAEIPGVSDQRSSRSRRVRLENQCTRV